MIENQPQVLQGIMDSHVQAEEAILNDPEMAAKVWADAGGPKSELALSAIEKNIEISESMWDVGFSQGAFESLGEMLTTTGLTDGVPNWNQFVDQQFLPEDKRIDLG